MGSDGEAIAADTSGGGGELPESSLNETAVYNLKYRTEFYTCPSSNIPQRTRFGPTPSRDPRLVKLLRLVAGNGSRT